VSSHLRTVLLGTAHVDRENLMIAAAIRTAVVVGIAVSLAVATGRYSLGVWLGVGALFVAMAEAGEGIGRRWRTMLWVTLWLMLATFAGALVSERPALVIIGSVVAAFAGGVAGVAGPRAALGGVLALVTFIISAGTPEMPESAAVSALLMGLGGVIMTAVTVVPHLFQDRSALRTALGDVTPLWTLVRPRLHWSEPFVRHGVRLAIGIGLATAFAEASGLPHAYWLPMTIAWITKPDLEGTVSRVAGRILGTVAGLGICALALLVFGASGYLATALSALAAGLAIAFIWANYAVAVTGVTVMVVVVFSLDGDDVAEDLVVRLAATLLAAVMAVAGSYLWRHGTIGAADRPPAP
jgi:hypothetical protein